MRRLTAYITMGLSLLIATGVSMVPTLSMMNADMDYAAGNEIVYNLTNKDDGSAVDNKTFIENVAEEMRDRLDTYDIDSYSVVIEGTDSIKVKFAAENDTEYQCVREYLAFSGGDFSMATKDEETRRSHDILFKDSEARIEYVNSVPYVVIPVSDTSEMKTLIETAQKATEESGIEAEPTARIKRHEEGDADSAADLFLWANWEEGDDYEKAEADSTVTGQKIIAAFNSTNIWYKNGLKDDEEPTEIQYLCGFADAEGNYDANKLEEANDMAVRLTRLFNASSYEDVEVKLTYERQIDANVEALVSPGKVNLSTTLVATLIALVILALFMVVFNRLAAIGVVSNIVVTVYASILLFMALGATMNVATLVGVVIVALASLITSLIYLAKLKQEVYLGRTLKKANQEALKKFTLPTIDAAIVMAFSGLMIFLLGGSLLKSMGAILFFGAIFLIASNEILFRIMMNFLCTSSHMQNKINLLNFDPKAVVNPMEAKEEASEDKPAPAKIDYTKRKKVVGIAAGVLILAGAVMSTIFGVKNKTILNTPDNKQTNVYLVVEYDEGANLTIKNEEFFEENILGNIKVNGEELSYTAVEMGTRQDTNYETTVVTTFDYYVTTFNTVFTNDDRFVYTYEGTETEAYTIEEAIYGLAEKYEPYVNTSDYMDTAAKVSYETVIDEPNFGWTSLACAISIIGATLLYALRYRPSRGIAAGVMALAMTFISIALFVITRIPAAPVVTIIMPAVMIFALLSALFFMNKDKEMVKEIRTADLTVEKRHEIMVEATQTSSVALSYAVIVAVYFGINYFGFGPSAYAALFGGFAVSIILLIVMFPALLGPLTELFGKWFSKVHLPKAKAKEGKKQRIKLHEKPKTSEPEETIFIGIND